MTVESQKVLLLYFLNFSSAEKCFHAFKWREKTGINKDDVQSHAVRSWFAFRMFAYAPRSARVDVNFNMSEFGGDQPYIRIWGYVTPNMYR